MDSQNYKTPVVGHNLTIDGGVAASIRQNFLKKERRLRPFIQLNYLYQGENENKTQYVFSDPEEEYTELPPRILVAEDNALSSKYISILLEQKGILFDLVDDGRLVVERTQQQKYNLILMDVHMPGLDGYQATNQIRQTSNPNQDTPIIALTASDPTMHKEKAVSSGMNDFLLKPYKRENLYSILELYLPLSSTSFDPNKKKATFQFSTQLDAALLEGLYQDDVEYAEEMFQLFFKVSLPEFQALRPLVEKEDWKAVQAGVHKLKPAFKMIGLPKLWEKMKSLEEVAELKQHGKATDISAPALLQEINTELTVQLPIVQSELERIQNYIRRS